MATTLWQVVISAIGLASMVLHYLTLKHPALKKAADVADEAKSAVETVAPKG